MYLLQVLRNSKAMADRLQEHGYSLVSGGALRARTSVTPEPQQHYISTLDVAAALPTYQDCVQ